MVTLLSELDLVKNQILKNIISRHWRGSLLISFNVFPQNHSWSPSTIFYKGKNHVIKHVYFSFK